MFPYTKQSTHVRPSAAAFILDPKEDKIFLIRRNTEPDRGLWMMPGGHQKVGETIEDCVVREVKEETGMTVMINKLFTVYSHPEQDPRHAATVVFFITTPVHKELVKSVEVMESGWFSFNEVPKEMAFHHRRIFDEFMKDYQPGLFTDFISEHPFVCDDKKAGRVLCHTKIGDVYMYRLEMDPGVVSGNYYHKDTSVMLSVEQGKVLGGFEQVKTKERKEIRLEPHMQAVHIPPYVALSTRNVGDEKAILYIFSNKKLRSGDDYPYPVFEE